ncbi:MFS transporter [Kutzneria sp. NPDC052558]|uniref:MFS transporter n=1 Tax=Kutzneria sp. NPDC052558 TaxID=3364121 RepID=UPI0037C85A92
MTPLVRLLCLANMAKTTANGVLMAVLVLYFTRSVHIGSDEVGLALSVGAGIGLTAAVPAGRLSDKHGPRETASILLCALGLATCAYPLTGDFAGLMIVSALVLTIESGANASVYALVAGLLPTEERVRASSYIRAASNISIAAGAAAGAIGLYLDTPAGYLTLLVGAGSLFIVSGLLFRRLPKVPTTERKPGQPVWPVLRDLPYVAVALLNSVLVMNAGVLSVALPIWIAQSTAAPTWVYAVVVIVNATAVVLLQVRVSKGVEDVPGGVKAWRRAAILLAAGCGLYALAGGLLVWAATAVLLVGAVAHVLGEMLHASGAWALGYGLAPDHAQGQYQGLFTTSSQLGQTITPVLATALLTHLGAAGWAVFAGLFLAAGALTPRQKPVVRQ